MPTKSHPALYVDFAGAMDANMRVLTGKRGKAALLLTRLDADGAMTPQ